MPSSAVTRLNKITYSSFVVGVGTNYHLHGPILRDESYQALTLRFLVVVHNDTVSTFNTQVEALIDAFRVPNGALKLEIGSSTALDLSHSGNTGMLARPDVSKVKSSLNSNNTALYACSVTVQLPADETGKAGRQSARVVYTSDGAGITRLDIQAVYTGISSNDSLAQAKANFPAYATSLQTVEGGTWDEVDAIRYAHDSEDKVCQVSASYIQVIANQSSGTANDTTLQGVRIFVATSTQAPGDAKGSGAKPLQEITVDFSCQVRKSVSTDLRNVWLTKVRPRMIEVASDLSGTSQLAAVAELPGLSPMSNSISARMVFLGTQVSLLSSSVVVSEVETVPFIHEPVLSGEPFDRDRHRVPSTAFARVRSTVLEIDTKSDRSLGSHKEAIRILVSQGFHVMQESILYDERERAGLQGAKPLFLRARGVEALLEYATVVGGGLLV